MSLFSGCGGLDLGFEIAGYEIIWANDFDKDACTTYNRNFKNKIIYGDIKNMHHKKNKLCEKVDIIIGGCPCQGFSVSNNNRGVNDLRNHLYKEMIRIIKLYRPKLFLFENVKGILSLDKGKFFEKIINDFTNIGYECRYKTLNSNDYGVPQNRERVFIVGSLIKLNNPFPNKTSKGLSVKETIQNFANLNEDKKINHQFSKNVKKYYFKRKNKVNQFEICSYLKKYRQLSKISTKKIDSLLGYKHTAGHWFRTDNNCGSIPKPKDWLSLKKILKFDDKYDKLILEFEKKEILFEQSLRISNWDTPSDTITASQPEIHPNEKRRLSVRELAELQTFPANFIFTGSLSSMYKQVGNAVPVKLSYEIASNLKINLDKYWYNKIENEKYSREKNRSCRI